MPGQLQLRFSSRNVTRAYIHPATGLAQYFGQPSSRIGSEHSGKSIGLGRREEVICWRGQRPGSITTPSRHEDADPATPVQSDSISQASVAAAKGARQRRGGAAGELILQPDANGYIDVPRPALSISHQSTNRCTTISFTSFFHRYPARRQQQGDSLTILSDQCRICSFFSRLPGSTSKRKDVLIESQPAKISNDTRKTASKAAPDPLSVHKCQGPHHLVSEGERHQLFGNRAVARTPGG